MLKVSPAAFMSAWPVAICSGSSFRIRPQFRSKWACVLPVMTATSLIALCVFIFASKFPLLDQNNDTDYPYKRKQFRSNEYHATEVSSERDGLGLHGRLQIAPHSELTFPAGLPPEEPNDRERKLISRDSAIRLAMVVCGDRMTEALTSVKSALLVTPGPFLLHLFVEVSLMEDMRGQLAQMKALNGKSLNFELSPIQFPAETEKIWKNLFKLCACQRLFLPDILASVDSVVYVDTDTLFLRPLHELWDHFARFNESHIAGLVPETEDDSTNWYVRFARHPFFPPRGVNSGVMLMNLTRMRAFGWTERLLPVYQQYSSALTWGDQDVINIVFHQHSDKLYTFGCEWNFRPDHCMYMSVCREAEREGAAVIHGSRGFFYNRKQPAFTLLHSAIQKFEMKLSNLSPWIRQLEDNMRGVQTSNCGKVWPIFTKGLSKLTHDSSG